MNRFKRTWAVILSAAMVLSSASFAPVNVYGAEDDILLVDDSSSDMLSDEGGAVVDGSEGAAGDSSAKLADDGEAVLEGDNEGVLADTEDDAVLAPEPEEIAVLADDGNGEEQMVSANATKTKTYDAPGDLQAVKVGDFVYVVDTQFAVATAWEPVTPQELMEVTVPSVIQLDRETYDSGLLDDDYEREVIAVGAGAFTPKEGQGYSLKTVELGESVKIIGVGAFSGCTSLTSIKFPENMTRTATDVYGEGYIGDNAFSGCTALETVTLPKKLDSVGGGIFADCSSLKAVEIPGGWGNTKVKKGDSEYKYAENTEVKGPFADCASLATITFEAGTSKIADGMLANCDSIENITLPVTLTDIGVKSFYGCDGLKSVGMENTALVDVGNWAFQKCTSLTSARLPKYTKTIGQAAFIDCTELTETSIPFSITSVGERAYFNCVKLDSVTFDDGDPQNITGGTIGKYAFGDNTYNTTTGTYKHPLENLATISIPNSITTIGEGAFEGCIGLTNLEFEDRFSTFTESQTIGKRAFYNCWSLTTVNYSSNLATIGESSFENCSSLGGLVIPNSVKTIYKAAFKSCSSVNSLKLSETLEELYEEAFSGCESLRQLYVPMSIKKVCPSVSNTKVTDNDAKKGAFYGTSITDVEFKRYNLGDPHKVPEKIMLGAPLVQNIKMPEGEVTEIGSFAFAFCTALKEIHLPNSLVTICGGAFGCCSRLGQKLQDGSPNPIVIPENVTSIGRSTFKYCTSIETVVLPASLESLGRGEGDGAFESCTSLREIFIPDTVNEIGASTFASCEKLERAKLPAGTTKIDDKLFLGCMKLAQVDNVSKDYLEEIGAGAFEGCTLLTSFDGSGAINFSDFTRLWRIGDRAFYGCDGITTVALSAATTSLGTSAFDSCKNLSDLTIGTGPKVIPESAFANDPGLVKVIIPRNVGTLKQRSFYKDINLREIHIPKDTQIEDEVFSYCDNLIIYGSDPSPAKTYADDHDIDFEVETVYAESLKFTDKTPVLLKLGSKDIVNVPGVDIKPVNYSVDVKYTSTNESIFKVEEYTDTKTKETKYKLVPVGVGTAELKAQAPKDASGSMVSDSVNVTVKKPVTGVSMAAGMKKDNTINIPDQKPLQLAVVVKPDDATDKTVRWVSGDESICNVDSEGVVRPINVGETTVAAISNDDETKGFVFNVTVTDSPLKPADPDWPNTISKPRVVGASGSITKAYGAEVELTCDTPGAQVYFTVNGSVPMADYEGRTDGSTERYSKPIVLDRATFGDEAIEAGSVLIRAISVCEGYQYSQAVDFKITLSENSEWGDIDGSTRTALFNDNLEKVPTGIWFVFDGDDTCYTKGGVTKVSRDYENGTKVTFNEGIRVFYGTSLLYEGRDYKTAYGRNTEVAPADGPNPPIVTIKGSGSVYKGSETFSFSIVDTPKPAPSGKTTADKVEIVDLNTAPVFTGKALTANDLSRDGLSPVKLRNKDTGAYLQLGTDYSIDPSTLRASGSFRVRFNLQGDNYEGTLVSDQIRVVPYNLTKDKDGEKKVTVKVNDGKVVYYSKTGVRPEVVVTFNGVVLKEGLDYTLKFRNNKKLSNGKNKASVIIYGKGNLRGKYTQEFTVGKQDLANVSLVAVDKVVKSGGKGSLKVLPVLMDDGKVLSRLRDYNRFTMADCRYTYASGAKDGQPVGDSDETPENGTLIRVEVDVTVKDSGPYKSTKKPLTMSAYYRIISKDLKRARVTTDKVFIYNEGKTVQIDEEDLKVTLGDEVVPSSDYEIVSVKNNRLIGTATVEIKGKGNFGGTKRFRVKIKPRNI